MSRLHLQSFSVASRHTKSKLLSALAGPSVMMK